MLRLHRERYIAVEFFVKNLLTVSTIPTRFLERGEKPAKDQNLSKRCKLEIHTTMWFLLLLGTLCIGNGAFAAPQKAPTAWAPFYSERAAFPRAFTRYIVTLRY
jgi:hypothetical protein